jgi:hypothetical protein
MSLAGDASLELVLSKKLLSSLPFLCYALYANGNSVRVIEVESLFSSSSQCSVPPR